MRNSVPMSVPSVTSTNRINAWTCLTFWRSMKITRLENEHLVNIIIFNERPLRIFFAKYLNLWIYILSNILVMTNDNKTALLIFKKSVRKYEFVQYVSARVQTGSLRPRHCILSKRRDERQVSRCTLNIVNFIKVLKYTETSERTHSQTHYTIEQTPIIRTDVEW